MARDLDELLTAVRAQVPGCAEVTAIRPLSTGHSNETYLLEGVSAVLRLPPGAQPLVRSAHDIGVQAAIFEALAAIPSGPPVPAVRYACADATVLGDPFFVMDFVAGDTFSEYAIPDWLAEQDDAFRATVVTNYADTFADMHRLGPLPVLGAPQTMSAELERWRSVAENAHHSELLTVFNELAQTMPPDHNRPTLVHGDPKPVNLLFSGSRVAAVLDWEMAFNGDPRWDLGYMLVFFSGELHPGFAGCDLSAMASAADTIAHWELRTGYSAKAWRWFLAASQAKISALMAYGQYLAEAGLSDDARLAEWEPYVQDFIDRARANITETRVV